MKPVALLAVFLAAASLVGCGSQDDTASDPAPTTTLSTPTTSLSDTSTPPTTPPTTQPAVVLPVCDEVWVGQAKLPAHYRGCTEGAEDVEAAAIRCEFGLSIVTYANRFYAVPGRVINDVGNLRKSDQYQRALESCLG